MTVTCCPLQTWIPKSLPGMTYPLATMSTVLWEALRYCITLRCVVPMGLVMSWPSRLLFGPALLRANNPLKNVSSEFKLLCKKVEPLHFIQAGLRVVLSTAYSNFANKVPFFSRTFSRLIAKGKRCSVTDTIDLPVATWVRLLIPFIFEQLRLV